MILNVLYTQGQDEDLFIIKEASFTEAICDPSPDPLTLRKRDLSVRMPFMTQVLLLVVFSLCSVYDLATLTLRIPEKGRKTLTITAVNPKTFL